MITLLAKYVWLFAGITLVTGIHFEEQNQQKPLPLTLMVDRKDKTNECMRGYFMTKRSGEKDAKVQCLVLELPPRGATPVLNGIPVGTYKVKVHLDGERGWRLEILNIPGRKSVFVRLGNCPANTASCLLVGTKSAGDECTVADTDAAMKDLRVVFKDFGPGAETMITIR